jgi:hypothetical protein
MSVSPTLTLSVPYRPTKPAAPDVVTIRSHWIAWPASMTTRFFLSRVRIAQCFWRSLVISVSFISPSSGNVAAIRSPRLLAWSAIVSSSYPAAFSVTYSGNES